MNTHVSAARKIPASHDNTTFGNVSPASHGETRREVLGEGDPVAPPDSSAPSPISTDYKAINTTAGSWDGGTHGECDGGHVTGPKPTTIFLLGSGLLGLVGLWRKFRK